MAPAQWCACRGTCRLDLASRRRLDGSPKRWRHRKQGVTCAAKQSSRGT
eukprot:CAMPEP_0198242778 /NCGR_PEP_ID=MMETSP1446-20131203/20629_1 /TAXON_ID=1461542 ORGANISM="Unidentified sp, Strain CCMP2111" /NCGR_SAMPLE_ID=MMETSP1446 /ASSEMBLY_ACC=CAM_ASM_001112 /LENGTH=48 /DNA_ID= /DNA_START= /DNA_END= /DNA_ORIENTATION=